MSDIDAITRMQLVGLDKKLSIPGRGCKLSEFVVLPVVLAELPGRFFCGGASIAILSLGNATNVNWRIYKSGLKFTVK